MTTENLERAIGAAKDVLAGVKQDQLDDPTPCASWKVRDLINHLVGGSYFFASATNAGEVVRRRERARLRRRRLRQLPTTTGAKQAVEAFNVPGAQEKIVKLPFGEFPGSGFMGLATVDTFTHAWDLAKATGQSTDLDPELAEQLLAASKATISDEFRGDEPMPFAKQKERPPARRPPTAWPRSSGRASLLTDSAPCWGSSGAWSARSTTSPDPACATASRRGSTASLRDMPEHLRLGVRGASRSGSAPGRGCAARTTTRCCARSRRARCGRCASTSGCCARSCSSPSRSCAPPRDPASTPRSSSIGSGAGGATTAAVLAEAGRRVTVVEEGPWVDPDAVEPFSLEEMVREVPPPRLVGGAGLAADRLRRGPLRRRQHRDQQRAVAPPARRPRRRVARRATTSTSSRPRRSTATRSGSRRGSRSRTLPGAPPLSSALLERGATKLGWRSVEFPRVFRYADGGRGVKQTMARTLIPRAVDAGADGRSPTRASTGCCRDGRPRRSARRARAPTASRSRSAPSTSFVCGGAVQTPALLQRSGFRRGIGSGLKLHPTIKIAARFPHPVDHDDVPMHRVTEFAPEPHHRRLGQPQGPRRPRPRRRRRRPAPTRSPTGSTCRCTTPPSAATPAAGCCAVPGLAVAARDLPADRRRPVAGWPAGSCTSASCCWPPARPSCTRRSIGGTRRRDRSTTSARGGTQVDRRRANLMTVHLTSSVRMGEDRARCRRRQLRPRARRREPARQRRVAAARRAGREPAGGDHDDRPPQRRALPRHDGVTRPGTRPDTVVVTGAAGWLGQNLVRALARPRPRALPRARRRATAPLLEVVGAERRGRRRRRPRPATRSTGSSTASAARHGVPRRGGHPPAAARARAVRRQRRRHAARPRPGPPRRRAAGSCTCRRTRRSAPTRRRRPLRRVVAVQPVPGLRPVEAGGRGASCSRSHERGDVATVDRAAAVVLRPVPARAADAVVRGRAPRPVPARGRRHAAALDGLRRQPRPRPAAGRGRATAAPGRAYWIADPEPYALRDVLETVRAALEAEGLARRRRRCRGCPRLAGVVAERVDGLLQARGRYVQAVHVLGELKDTIACDVGAAQRRARLRARRRRCSTACGRQHPLVPRARASRSDERLLVTGGAGYFGTILADRALARGDDGARPRPQRARAARDGRRGRRRRRARPPTRCAPRATASTSSCNNVAQVPLAKDRELFWSVNVGGTANVLVAARRRRRRQGRAHVVARDLRHPGAQPGRRATPPRPLEAYGRAKLEAEALCRDAVAGGLDVTIVRPRTILGHGRLGIMAVLFELVAEGAPVFVLGSAATTATSSSTPRTSPTPCLRAADRPGPGDLQHRRHRVRHDARDAAGARRPRRAPARGSARCRSAPARLGDAGCCRPSGMAPFAPYHWLLYGESLWFDTTKAQTELGWTPTHSNASMVIESYEWFLRPPRRARPTAAARTTSRRCGWVRCGCSDGFPSKVAAEEP